MVDEEDKVRKRYEELVGKYKLPAYEELEEFQISGFEDSKFLLDDLREKILDKLRESTDFLSEIIHPDTTMITMHESSIFDDSQKREFSEVFGRLMFLRRNAFEASIDGNEAVTAEFISNFFEEWKVLKPELIGIISRVKNSWKSQSEQTETLGYFG